MKDLSARFLSFLNKFANWKAILVLTALFFLFSLYIMPTMASLGGTDLPSLDTRFWYTPQQAHEIIAQYSPEARQAAVLTHLVADLFYPLVYGLLISALLIVVFRRASPEHQHQLPFLPWRAVIADFLENLGIVAMLLLFPTRFDLLSWVTTIFTALKWLQIGFSFLALLVGVLILVLKKAPRRV